MTPTIPCPCGSDKSYATCCEPLHCGHAEKVATSVEALMRSRYSAFALGLSDYLIASWHPDTRPEDISLDPSTRWRRLEIIDANNDDHQGLVHFKAYYQEPSQEYSEALNGPTDQWHLLEETSKFLFEKGCWFYHSGNYQPQTLKPKRNDTCPCGSGKKFKKCCL